MRRCNAARIALAGNVGDMLATCWQRANLLPILTRHACQSQHIFALTQDFCVGDCNYKKSMYKLNHVGKLEKYTPQTPKITKNDPPAPYPPAALPPIWRRSSPWSRARRPWLGLVAQCLVCLFRAPKRVT